MPLSKVTQLVATVIDHPYKEKLAATKIPVPLYIESAIYYDPADLSVVLDVEPYISPLLLNNHLSFVVENDLFGGDHNDPAPGVVKELKLVYNYNGIKSTLICREKATVVLQAY